MAIIETFSKRRRATLRGNEPDVFVYDELPVPLREQIIHIINDAFADSDYADELLEHTCELLAREHGVATLAERGPSGGFVTCHHHLRSADWDRALDLVEMLFQIVQWGIDNPESAGPEGLARKGDALAELVDELNARFREHAVGYHFEEGRIVRVDSKLLHAEVVKPALRLLNRSGFSGPEEEFLSGYEHFRHGRHEEALVDAGKAFESTLRAVCEERGWQVDETANAQKLIEVVFQRDLVSKEMQSLFTGLRSTLESGVPTLRNRRGAHGRGKVAQPGPPTHLVAYALHMAASAIVFLVEAHRAVP